MGFVLAPGLEQPTIRTAITVPTVALATMWRLRGMASHKIAPRITANNTKIHSECGTDGHNPGAPGVPALSTVAANKLEGTVTENELLVPPGNCASAVLTFSFAPDEGVQITSEPELKFAPLTVSVTLLPAVIAPGDAAESVGTGPSTPKFSAFCTPLTLT